MESWIAINCTINNCNAENFVNNGDISDQTVSDVEFVKCWKCKKVFPVDYEDYISEEELLDVTKNEYYDDGIKWGEKR